MPTAEGVFVWDELITDDVEAAKAFYGAVLGWVAEEMSLEGGSIYTLSNRSDGSNAAGCLAKTPEMQMPNMWMPYLGTANVDATASKAASLGAAVYAPAFDVAGVGRVAVLGDPTGAAFGLFKPAS
jgi:predicted enzyme related to lactoylglutathione lyase